MAPIIILLAARSRAAVIGITRLSWKQRLPRLALVVAIAAACAAAHAGTAWVLRTIAGVAPTDLLFDLLWGGLCATLAFSALLMALSQLFLADDLVWLAALPLRSGQVFWVKCVEVWLTTSWAPVLFGGAVLAAFGTDPATHWTFYIALMGCLLLVSFTVTAVGITVMTLAVSLLPAHRARDGLVFAILVGLLGLYVAVRASHPERILDAHGIAELSKHLAAPTWLKYSPAGWAAQTLRHWLSPQSASLAPLWLIASAAASITTAALVFRALFARCLSLTLSAGGRALRQNTPFASIAALTTAVLPRPMAAMARKDILTFARDPSQWSQLLLLASLALVYLLNLRAMPLDRMSAVGLTETAARNGFAFANIFFTGLIVSGLALRFLFASVSREGRAAWLPQVSPLTLRAWLWSKWWVGTSTLIAFGGVLIAGGAWLLRPSESVTALSVLALLLLAAGLGGLGVGCGAAWPRFDATSPAMIAMSMGGLAFLLLALGYVTLLALVLAYPVFAAAMGALAQPAPAALVGLAIALSATTTWGAMRLGEERLATRDS